MILQNYKSNKKRKINTKHGCGRRSLKRRLVHNKIKLNEGKRKTPELIIKSFIVHSTKNKNNNNRISSGALLMRKWLKTLFGVKSHGRCGDANTFDIGVGVVKSGGGYTHSMCLFQLLKRYSFHLLKSLPKTLLFLLFPSHQLQTDRRLRGGVEKQMNRRRRSTK